jgi:hypothetical protein
VWDIAWEILIGEKQDDGDVKRRATILERIRNRRQRDQNIPAFALTPEGVDGIDEIVTILKAAKTLFGGKK